jgi:hypothetical protein
MRQTVEVLALFLTPVVAGPRLRLRNKVIAALGYVWTRGVSKIKGERIVVKLREIIKDVSRERPETLTNLVKLGFRIGKFDSQPLVHIILVEPLEEFAPGIVHAGTDARRQRWWPRSVIVAAVPPRLAGIW